MNQENTTNKPTAAQRLREQQRQARSDAAVRRHANAGNTSVRKPRCGDMLTKSRINKAIAHTGLQVWGNGDGYFYFLDKVTGNQIGRCVYVCRINHQSLADWVRDAEEAKTSGIIEGVQQ